MLRHFLITGRWIQFRSSSQPTLRQPRRLAGVGPMGNAVAPTTLWPPLLQRFLLPPGRLAVGIVLSLPDGDLRLEALQSETVGLVGLPAVR